jgi:hypothetical protein
LSIGSAGSEALTDRRGSETLGFADGKPVHYPRAAPADWDGTARVPPNPEGKNYEWFAANDRTARFDSGPRQSLDPLWSPTGLTMDRKEGRG